MGDKEMKSTFTRKPRKSVRIAEPNEEQSDSKPTTKVVRKEVEVKEKLAGTRVSVLSGRPVISSGHGFIDAAWGGGIGVGQIVSIQEDINSTYYKCVLSLYLAQALALPQAQKCLIISDSPESFLPLPKPLHQKLSMGKDQESKPSSMKIAWRYDNIQERTDPSGNRREPFCDTFDLHKTMELSDVRRENIEFLEINSLRVAHESTINQSQQISSSEFLTALLERIRSAVDKAKEEKTVLRILIHSFGSPIWIDHRSDYVEKEFLLFIHKLKTVLRSSTSVCMMSYPQHLFSQNFISRIERFTDIGCQFKSFQGETNNEIDPAFADYHGFFNVTKLPRTNSLTRHMPDTPSYVFARKRHKLLVEVFALPPELSRTTESSTSQAATKMLCQPGPPKDNEIDF